MLYLRRIGSVSLGSATVLGLLLGGLSTSNVSAEDKLPALSLDSTTEVVLAAAINGLPAKTKLIATPSYEEYSLGPVVDGVKKRIDLNWQDAAWASAEENTPHGIEIRLSKPQRGGRFQVTWAYDIYNEDNGRWWISRNYLIQIKDNAGDAWKTVADVKNNQSVIGSYLLPDESYSFLRIYQAGDGGHPDRPNLMWVGQVELTD